MKININKTLVKNTLISILTFITASTITYGIAQIPASWLKADTKWTTQLTVDLWNSVIDKVALISTAWTTTTINWKLSVTDEISTTKNINAKNIKADSICDNWWNCVWNNPEVWDLLYTIKVVIWSVHEWKEVLKKSNDTWQTDPELNKKEDDQVVNINCAENNYNNQDCMRRAFLWKRYYIEKIWLANYSSKFWLDYSVWSQRDIVDKIHWNLINNKLSPMFTQNAWIISNPNTGRWITKSLYHQPISEYDKMRYDWACENRVNNWYKDVNRDKDEECLYFQFYVLWWK